jgi:hypothetical protein
LEEVMMEVDDNILLIVGNPQGIFRPAAQYSTNPLIKFYFFKLKILK